MRRNLVFFFLHWLLLSSAPLSAQSSPTDSQPIALAYPVLHPDAPPETKILSQLFGVWDAQRTKRNRDGSWASDSTRFEWRWYAILDGHAIQDDWIKFATNDGSAPMPQVVGTNIRIYNSDENRWHMAWIDKTNRKLATVTAKNENGTIVMSGKNAAGRPVRNTFFNIAKDQFDWRQEWTFDEGKSWVEVAKIHCIRKP
ncbi:MAG: hypothetical protein GKR89_16385 [Candidatus Latescibacteria bacterium]|nr:hypothetical protein [Candidatus Latescibacterota bacterium]